jgi:hypothetical protein
MDHENTLIGNSSGAGGVNVMNERHLRVIASGSAAGRGAAERGPAGPQGAQDLAALRALAECGELASAVSGLAGPDGGPLPAGPPGELAREIARALVEAGFAVHHCAGWDPQRRVGGVCVQPVPVRADPAGAGGVMVSWALHDLVELDPAREAEREATREIMDMALAEMLFALGYAIQPFGTSGAWMATGRRPGEREA